jgi:hypothetical protein
MPVPQTQPALLTLRNTLTLVMFAARVSHTLSPELTQGVKLYTQNVHKHGRFCCDPSCFEGASLAGLLPDPMPGVALPLDGRRS